MADQQNYSNHVRWYPLFHFVIIPLLTINLIFQIVRLIMVPDWDRGFWVLLGLVFILMALAGRLQVLQIQDRIIRLEEKLRYREVLPPELAVRAAGLSSGQIVALRFASDDELSDLIQRTLNGEFASGRDIKVAVRDWRGDHLRA